tara:strand:+ start:460 stop:909 length:450 start_codon:yes stop_codon:yes gene_type:complete
MKKLFNTLKIISNCLFIFLLLLALFDPPYASHKPLPSGSPDYAYFQQASSSNYSVFEAFIETSNNTVASWYGRSINLEHSRFSVARVELWRSIRESDPRGYFETGGQYESDLMCFASILPYLMGVLFLFSLFKYLEKFNEKDEGISKDF